MPWGDYTVLNNLKDELGISHTDTTQDTRFARIITAASRHVDHWCTVPNNYFVGKNEVRVFDVPPTLNGPINYVPDLDVNASGSPFVEMGGPAVTVLNIVNATQPVIIIDPLIGPPEEVAVDTTLDGTYASTMVYLRDFDLLPVNAQQDGYPYRQIRWLPATAQIMFVIGARTLRIKGLWGYNAPSFTVQTLSLTGNPTGGTFTLTYGGDTTDPIAYNASASDVEKALLALPSIARLTGSYQGTSMLELSDGELPKDTITMTMSGLMIGTGVAVGTNSLTGGVAPAPSLSGIVYTGPTYPSDIEEAVLLTCVRWIKLPSTAPLGALGTTELGHMRVQPSQDVIDILERGHWLAEGAWSFV